MNRYFWIIVAILILSGGAYFWLQPLLTSREQSVWDLVPENAVAVYESYQIVRDWNDFQDQPLWKNLEGLPVSQTVSDQVTLIDSMAGKKGNIDRILSGQPVLVSLHITAKDDFDFLFFIPLYHSQSRQVLSTILSSPVLKDFRKSSRVYQDFKINELHNAQTGKTLAYIEHGDHFVASFAPVLVEDVIRNLSQSDQMGFKSVHSSLFNLAKLENDQGNLYINLGKFNHFFSTFRESSLVNNNRGIPNLANSTFLDLSLTNTGILMNGFSLAEEDDFLNTFKGQDPYSFNLSNFVPNRTAALFHFTFTDPQKWQKSLYGFLEKKDPGLLDQIRKTNQQFDTDLSRMFFWFRGEAGLALLESVDVNSPGKLAFIKTKDLPKALNQINRLAENIVLQSEDTLYQEDYSGVTITQLYLPEFPSLLMGPVFSGFEQCFYIPLDDYVVFGNSIQSIKRLLNDIKLESTWGKSVSQIAFLENILQEANFSILVQTPSYWKMLISELNPKWKSLFTQYSSEIQSFDKSALQFAHIEGKFYTSFDINYNSALNRVIRQDAFKTVSETQFDTTLIIKPQVVRNHLTRNFEVLVQDIDNFLYLVSADGQVLWKRPLSSAIVSKIFQIDYYRNGKLQYFFATSNALYIIDRKGDDVQKYPMTLPGGVIVDHLNLIDYDNSKRYRFIVSDLEGNLYMFNQYQKSLEGWNPLPLKYPLAEPPFHVRVRNRDCIVALQRNGVANIITRRAQFYPGFPLDLGDPVFNPLFVKIGSDFDKTQFMTINEGGALVTFNLSGDITEKLQLYKPSKEVKFRLVSDALNRTFSIVRQELSRLSVLDQKGTLIFEKDYLSPEELKVQYYSFGSQAEFYCITDKVQDFTYIYDQNGNLINYQPLNSSFQVGLLNRGFEDYEVYVGFEEYLRVFSLKK